jgi:hypothetical protein
MAGMSQKEYNELVDESLILFGGGAPCANIDARMWADFKQLYKQYNDAVPKVINWSYDQVFEWLEAYNEQNEGN